MEIKDYNKIKDVKDTPCGMVKEGFIKGLGFARVKMSKGLSSPHYHKKLVEYYLVLEGLGTLKVKLVTGGVKQVDLKPGIIVKIEPREIHQTESSGSLVLEAITYPAWTLEDEIITKESLF